MYGYDFKCSCGKSFRSKGIYNKVRLVLDLKDFYYMATENLGALAWNPKTLNQLSFAIRIKFPAILTHKYTSDVSIIFLLKSRTIGNSHFALQNNLREIFFTEYLFKSLKHKSGLQKFQQQPPVYKIVESFKNVPTYKWFIYAYVKDVCSRSDCLKASLTSVFGDIIKIDSTKKILRKLAGEGIKRFSQLGYEYWE